MRRFASLAIVVLAIVLVAPAAGGDQTAPAQSEIDAAVRKGGRYLANGKDRNPRNEEIVGLTLIHAGVGPEDPAVAGRIQAANARPYSSTYRTALAIMLLEVADHDRYQKRIAELGQLLVDMQCPNGQWSYGDREKKEDDPEPRDPAPPEAPEKPSKPGKTESRKKPIRLKFTGPSGPDKGDNSNTQFGLLGLRACEDAMVEVPDQTWKLSRKWWQAEVKQDGGWGYHGKKSKDDPSYGAMTAVGVASLAICDHYLREDVRKEVAIPRALDWLAKHLTWEKNPEDPKTGKTMRRHYYWIYSVERAGVLARFDRLGDHPWYAEGARWLLEHQAEDGGWNGDPIDTCFAILFLKRATKPLTPRVYTPGGGK